MARGPARPGAVTSAGLLTAHLVTLSLPQPAGCRSDCLGVCKVSAFGVVTLECVAGLRSRSSVRVAIRTGVRAAGVSLREREVVSRRCNSKS